MKFSSTTSIIFFLSAAFFLDHNNNHGGVKAQPLKSNLRTKTTTTDQDDYLVIARNQSSSGLRGGSMTGLEEDTPLRDGLPTTLAQEMDKLERLKGRLEPDDEVLVLRDLLLKAANAKIELEQALQDAGVNTEEVESIFTDHGDLADDVLTAFDDLEEENRQLGDDITSFLQNHIIEEEDGTLRYRPSAAHMKEQEELERQKDRRRQLQEKSQKRWNKYHWERKLLTLKVREHHSILERHLNEAAHPCDNATATAADPAAESRCYSEALEGYQNELGDLVVVLEEELGPFTTLMDQIGQAVAGVRKAAGTVGTLAGMFSVLKKMPGFFKVIFGSAYAIFNGLDTGADPVEKAVDDFEDFVLSIWENTAGTVLDMIYGFEAHISNAVGLFSFAAEAQHIPALPGLVKGLFGIDLGQFSNSLQSVERHVHDILVKLRELMGAFASETFEKFHTTASDFIDAIQDINAFMVPFDAVVEAYEYEITLPFGMPRTLMSKKLGRASCSPHQNRYTRADQYSGNKIFDLVAPWNVKCKERCPDTHDALSGGLKCRKKCSSYGLGKHEVFGIQDGCLRASRDKPLRSLPWGQKCSKKIGSSWYRTLPSDKCRNRCHNWLGAGNYYAEFYGRCTLSCPSGMPNHPSFPNKACKIPDAHKFERTKLTASCSHYTNNGQLDVYLKATGGCYEDCKSNEHSFRAIFFCVSKDKLKISVKDVVDFIANVLSKIEKIPGVGEILTLIDNLLKPLFGFLQELIPDELGFPEFDMGIDVNFLNFGAVAAAFNKLDLPTLPQLQDVIGDTISSLGSKIQETPLGKVASCATDMECLVNATGLGGIQDKLESASSTLQNVTEKLSSIFGQDPGDIFSCAEGSITTQNISCSKMFSMFNVEDEECVIEMPTCQLNITTLEPALSGVADLFTEDFSQLLDDSNGLGGTERRQLSDAPIGTFFPIFPLFLEPHILIGSLKKRPSMRLRTSIFGDVLFPKQQIGMHLQVRAPILQVNFGIYKSECGSTKFAIEPVIRTDFMFGYTHGFNTMLEKTLEIADGFEGIKPAKLFTDHNSDSDDADMADTSGNNIIDQTGTGSRRLAVRSGMAMGSDGFLYSNQVPWIKNSYCYPDNMRKPNSCNIKDKFDRKDWLGLRYPVCKYACEADKLIYLPPSWVSQKCRTPHLKGYLAASKSEKGLTKSEKKVASKCIKHWFEVRRQVLSNTEYVAGLRQWIVGKWGWKKLTSFPLMTPYIWHTKERQRRKEFYYGPQVGVGLVGYDARTRTQLGPTVWFCTACADGEKPIATDLGSINPDQFRNTQRTLKDTSLYLRVSGRVSFGVVSFGGKNEADGKKARMVEGFFAKDYNCKSETIVSGNQTLVVDGNQTLVDGNQTLPDGNQTLPDGNQTLNSP